MSCPNFVTMEEFPLFACEDRYSKRCPHCGAYSMQDAETCDCCGESLEGADAEYDEWETREHFALIEQDIEQTAPYLEFFTITVQGGHYTGMQLLVEEKHPSFPDSYDNDDCHYYFECCRSRAIRKRAAEVNRVKRFMRKIAKGHGMDEYYCGDIFSNGEAVYHKVPDKTSTKREKLKYILATS